MFLLVVTLGCFLFFSFVPFCWSSHVHHHGLIGAGSWHVQVPQFACWRHCNRVSFLQGWRNHIQTFFQFIHLLHHHRHWLLAIRQWITDARKAHLFCPFCKAVPHFLKSSWHGHRSAPSIAILHHHQLSVSSILILNLHLVFVVILQQSCHLCKNLLFAV